MKKLIIVLAAAVVIGAAFAGGRGFVTGDTASTVSIAAPCTNPCSALEGVSGQGQTRLGERIVQMRPMTICHYRQIPGKTYDQPYWGAGIGWAPVTWAAGQDPKPDFTRDAGFTYNDQHPVYGHLDVYPKRGCPLLMRADYVTIPAHG